MSRVAALWFPRWPVQAALLDDPELTPPVAVVRQHRVVASDAPGVYPGMQARQAEALARVVESDRELEGVIFAGIITSLDEVAASVEVLRPGLVLVDIGAAGRFYGSEDRAVELLLDAAARSGVDMAIGVADELETAQIAARHSRIVPPGGSRDFLRTQPISVLGPDAAAFQRLGLRTLGDLANLPKTQVLTRFGAVGRRCYDIATAAPDRRVAPDLPTTQLAVSIAPEEPIDRVDAAAFAARQLAARLHERLAKAGLVCLRLRVTAEFTDGTSSERVWRVREALAESATADRVRWQLDGWVRNKLIRELTLDPLETATPTTWGSEEKAGPVIARVQSMLGTDKVLVPRLVGGRGAAERVAYTPYGEEPEPLVPGTWPGQMLSPLPSRQGDGTPVRLTDSSGRDVFVTAEALLSSDPHMLADAPVTAWAGPWPVDTDWWTQHPQRLARLQVVSGARAWLLVWENGGWTVEGTYF